MTPLTLAFLTISPGRALAFDHELQLGVHGLYAKFLNGETSSHGAGAGIHGRYGLNDSFALAIGGGWGTHWMADENDEVVEVKHIVTAGAGIQYAVDLLPVLPYIEVLLGASFGLGAEAVEYHFLVNAAVGMDWRFHESFSVGAEVAYQMRVASEIAPARLCVSVKLSWHHLFARQRSDIE